MRPDGRRAVCDAGGRLLASADAWLEAVDAGHGYLFLRSEGRAAEQATIEGSVPLGVQDGAGHRAIRMSVPGGARLITVSDGVIEQVNAEGEQFGIERVLGVLNGSESPADEISSLVGGCEGVCRGPLADDLSAASIRLG